MNYIRMSEASYREVTTPELDAWAASESKAKPIFLAESDAGVVAYLAAQAEATTKSQALAFEREAIDEVIREQFSKQIAERAEKKKAKLEKQRKG